MMYKYNYYGTNEKQRTPDTHATPECFTLTQYDHASHSSVYTLC